MFLDIHISGSKMKRNARRQLRPLGQQDLRNMNSALETTPPIMTTTLTIPRPPEHRTPLSASGFARTGMEEEADTIYGLGTRSLEGATSRAVWMVNSMPYNSLKMCMKTTITIMHLNP